MRTTVIFILLLSVVSIAGPVCGQHVNTAEALSCCAKGHNEEAPVSGHDEAHSSNCCSNCDLGKTNSTATNDSPGAFLKAKLFPGNTVTAELLPVYTESDTVRLAFESSWVHQKFVSESPPPLYLSISVFLI